MLDFDDLKEQLLRGGIAPRHVRRYLTELRHHYDDLIAEERAHGITGPAAHSAAIERLGSHDELAVALLAKRELRSMTARYPWLMFGVAPPLVMLLGSLLLLVAIILVGMGSGAVVPDHKSLLPVPGWFIWTAGSMVFAANFLIPALLGSLLAWMAQRQRMRLLWPLLGMAVILFLNLHAEFQADPGRIGITLGTMLRLAFHYHFAKGPFAPAGTSHWPALLGQAALLCLPVAWLWRARQKNASAQ